MGDAIKWSDEVRRYFGDVTSADRVSDWERAKQAFPVGSKVSGRVVLKAPFGVWLDVGAGFPALLLITQLATFYSHDTYWKSGPQLGETMDVTVLGFNEPARALGLTQKSLTKIV